MRILSDQEAEQICDALRLAAIFIQERPSDDAPSKKVRAALELMSRVDLGNNRIEELEDTLREVLSAISDTDGAILRPAPGVVERVKNTLASNTTL